MEITVKAASQQAKRSENTIRNWINSGKIEAIKKDGCWKISLASFQDYIANNSSKRLKRNVVDDSAIQKMASMVVAEIKAVLPETAKDEKNESYELELSELRKEKDLWKNRFSMLECQFTTLKEYVKELDHKVRKLEEARTANSVTTNNKNVVNEQLLEVPKKELSKEVDEKKAEKWLRENTQKWLDEPCSFKRADGRTWRQMAQNFGDKIPINGKGLQSPRAYLHAIESWKNCKVWARIKAKVVLEIVHPSASINHYDWPEEIGGL